MFDVILKQLIVENGERVIFRGRMEIRFYALSASKNTQFSKKNSYSGLRNSEHTTNK
jgi:hypothetical protein